MITRKLEIVGLENLNIVPAGEKLIFAVSHLTDLDVPIVVSVLAARFPVKIADQSTHHSLLAEPSMVLSNLVSGWRNYLPLRVHKQAGEKRGVFRQRELDILVRAVNRGFALVTAAENPSRDGKTARPGYAAPYVALRTSAYVIPVAVRIDAEAGMGMADSQFRTFLRRPAAKISIGTPIRFLAPNGHRLRTSDPFSVVADCLRENATKLQKILRSLL